MNKETEKLFSIVTLLAFIVTLVLSFMNGAFVPSCMLMLSLFLFSVCYRLKDNKKVYMYILFVVGVLLIIGSLGYTYMRIN